MIDKPTGESCVMTEITNLLQCNINFKPENKIYGSK